jgi:hypothetical protein
MRTTPMPDTMRVRLYWLDGRVEEPKGEVDAATTVIVRQSGTGHRHFIFAEEIDDEGFAIFWEDEDAPPGPARTDDG